MRLAFASLLLAAVPAFAHDARLEKVSGPVSYLIEGGSRWRTAKGGEELLFGDAVRVGKGGVAHLTLGARAAVLLREETTMVLKGSAADTLLSFRFGEFLIGLRYPLGSRERFRVRTPAAMGAVRGTLFWGKSDKDTKATTYAGFGHTVAVTAKGKTSLVAPGKTVTVAFGEAPSDPAPSALTLDYAKKFAVDGDLQGLEKLAE